ncbi:MAG: DUF1573 domain-containing protein [Gemmataceae bacterium]|nr:DUF1573 domain-containing protein [Gemmataceae bacterium]
MRVRAAVIGAVLVALVAVGALFGFQFRTAREPAVAAKPADPVVVPDGRGWFGEVWLTNDFAWSFPVVNRAERPVSVRNVTGSCNCLSVTPRDFTVEPGESQTVEVRIDFTVKPRKDENAAFALDYEYSAGPESAPREGRWVLSGKVRPLLALSAPLHLGRRSVLAQPLPPLSVEGRTATAHASVTATPVGPGLRAEVVYGDADDRFRLTVTPSEAYPVGRVERAVLLKVELASGEVRTERIPVTGLIVPDAEPSPLGYPAGGRLVGETFEFDVTLSSATGTPFSVVGVRAVGDGLAVTPADGRYIVRQTCTAEGVQAGRIDFEVEAADGRYMTTVAVDYTGFRP